MIRYPPIEVPKAITAELKIISQTGIKNSVTWYCPWDRNHAEHENAHKFLTVLSSVHESHRGRADDLSLSKEILRLLRRTFLKIFSNSFTKASQNQT